jgi:hypothetical protein
MWTLRISGIRPLTAAVSAVARRQYVDWRELRLEDPASPDHRKGVHRLALRLVEISETVGARPVTIPEEGREARLAEASAAISGRAGVPDDERQVVSEEPGLLDVLAEAETALPRWNETIGELGEALTTIGQDTEAATKRALMTRRKKRPRASSSRRCEHWLTTLERRSESSPASFKRSRPTRGSRGTCDDRFVGYRKDCSGSWMGRQSQTAGCDRSKPPTWTAPASRSILRTLRLSRFAAPRCPSSSGGSQSRAQKKRHKKCCFDRDDGSRSRRAMPAGGHRTRRD